MEWLFGKQLTPKEMLREHQRTLRKSMREIERERLNLQNQEKKITTEIKNMAKKGQMGAARIMARDLVRTRNSITKFYKLHSQLQAVSIRLQTLQSTASMADAMKGATKAMFMMNRQINLPGMQRIMMEFEKQTEKMEMKEEMMNDAIDGVMEEEGDEAESDEIINKVLDEIGIDLSQQLVDAPTTGAAQTTIKSPEKAAVAVGAGADPADLDLQARLDKLRKD